VRCQTGLCDRAKHILAHATCGLPTVPLADKPGFVVWQPGMYHSPGGALTITRSEARSVERSEIVNAGGIA
jgi:hypothetical protein